MVYSWYGTWAETHVSTLDNTTLQYAEDHKTDTSLYTGSKAGGKQKHIKGIITDDQLVYRQTKNKPETRQLWVPPSLRSYYGAPGILY